VFLCLAGVSTVISFFRLRDQYRQSRFCRTKIYRNCRRCPDGADCSDGRPRCAAGFRLVGPICIESDITDDLLDRVADELAKGTMTLNNLVEAADSNKRIVSIAVNATGEWVAEGDGNIVRIRNTTIKIRIIWVVVFSTMFCWAAFTFLVYRRYVLFGR
jgi:hypothetical protein